MKEETIKRGQQLLEQKVRYENAIKAVENSLISETRPVTRMIGSWENSATLFQIDDREFIKYMSELWKQKQQTRLAEINLELDAL